MFWANVNSSPSNHTNEVKRRRNAAMGRVGWADSLLLLVKEGKGKGKGKGRGARNTSQVSSQTMNVLGNAWYSTDPAI
jgi:hypothetical protein